MCKGECVRTFLRLTYVVLRASVSAFGGTITYSAALKPLRARSSARRNCSLLFLALGVGHAFADSWILDSFISNGVSVPSVAGSSHPTFVALVTFIDNYAPIPVPSVNSETATPGLTSFAQTETCTNTGLLWRSF